MKIRFKQDTRSQANAWNGLRILGGMPPLDTCTKCGGITVDGGPLAGKCKCPEPAAITPPLDCSREELVAYIRSMKGGERVMEMGDCAMKDHKGRVLIKDDRVYIQWDHAEYVDGAGCMTTSFTGGARIIPDEKEEPNQPTEC